MLLHYIIIGDDFRRDEDAQGMKLLVPWKRVCGRGDVFPMTEADVIIISNSTRESSRTDAQILWLE